MSNGVFLLGPSMSLTNNFDHQIRPASDLSVKLAHHSHILMSEIHNRTLKKNQLEKKNPIFSLNFYYFFFHITMDAGFTQSYAKFSHTTYRKNNNLEKCAGMGLNGFHIK